MGASFFVSTPISPPFPPSPHPHPPRYHHTDDTHPNLCTLVELYRHPESCRAVSKCWILGKLIVFSKKPESFRTSGHIKIKRGTSRSKNVKTQERMGNQGSSESCTDTRKAVSSQLKKSIGKDGYVGYFSYFCKKFFEGIAGKNMG